MAGRWGSRVSLAVESGKLRKPTPPEILKQTPLENWWLESTFSFPNFGLPVFRGQTVNNFWGVHLVKAMFVTFYCSIFLPKLLMSIPLMLVIGNLALEMLEGPICIILRTHYRPYAFGSYILAWLFTIKRFHQIIHSRSHDPFRAQVVIANHNATSGEIAAKNLSKLSGSKVSQHIIGRFRFQAGFWNPIGIEDDWSEGEKIWQSWKMTMNYLRPNVVFVCCFRFILVCLFMFFLGSVKQRWRCSKSVWTRHAET